jgi:acetyl-CoA carboxylase carboxyl transferase subunit alpha
VIDFKDDKAMIGGLGNRWTIIHDCGQQKDSILRCVSFNFWMANPEGYRKALRLMKWQRNLAFVLTLIDNSGAYPGLLKK